MIYYVDLPTFPPHRMGWVEGIYTVRVPHLYRRCGWVDFEKCVEHRCNPIHMAGRQSVPACSIRCVCWMRGCLPPVGIAPAQIEVGPPSPAV